MNRTLLSLGIVLTLLAGGACRSEAPAENTVDGGNGDIRVGLILDLSGEGAAAGQSLKNGAEMARDEINAGGGVLSRQVELVVEDGRGTPEQAGAAVAKLTGEGRVRALVGGLGSAGGSAAAKAQAGQVPFVVASVTDPKATEAGDYVFRVAVPDSFQGEAMAKYAANNLIAGSAAILSEADSAYGDGLARVFDETFSGLGGRVVQRQTYAGSDQDFKSQLTTISAANPDVIYVPGRDARIAAIARQAKELGIRASLLGSDGWTSPQVLQAGGSALDGVYATGLYSADDPTPEARKFASAYRTRYGNPPDAHAALGYDAVRLLADAISRAGSDAGPKLRAALGQTANFGGVTGAITLTPERNATRPTVIFKLQDGKAFPVYREEPRPGGAAGQNPPAGS
jgi:branched-chain amino acid transport system substrate-binding protein